MKHFVVVDHKAHVLANKLWSDLSVRAAGYEYGARIWNMTVFESHWWTRWLHTLLSRLLEISLRRQSVWALGAPKTLAGSEHLQRQSVVYFFGWLFRDLVLMEKYRVRVVASAFSDSVRRQAAQFFKESSGKVCIGVRHRTRPFIGFTKGEYLISRNRIDQIIAEYLERHRLGREQVAFIEVPDDVSKDDITGLCALSQCSVVIGDNSTFSNLAAWLGNVPHVVTSEDPIDWDYYEGKDCYFENRYATFTHGSLRP